MIITKIQLAAMERVRGEANVITLRGSFIDRGDLLIVMDEASGGDLFSRVLESDGLEASVARDYFAQMLAGVEQMHACGVAHRDLKLDNAVIDGMGRVRWCDLGLAHLGPRVAAVRMAKGAVGSKTYMAPEVAALRAARDNTSCQNHAEGRWRPRITHCAGGQARAEAWRAPSSRAARSTWTCEASCGRCAPRWCTR